MKLLAGNYDITQMYDQITWSGADGQAARKIEFGMVVSGTDKNLPRVTLRMNDPVRLYNDKDQLIFEGEIISKEKSISNNMMAVEALDKLFKANAIELSYSFDNKTPDQIASQVFSDVGISVGKLETGSPLSRIFDVEKAYNIVLIAYRLEYEKTKVPYIIRMNGTNAEVAERGKIVAKWQLDPKANLIDSTYSENIRTSVDSVKMFDKDGNERGTLDGKIEMPKATVLTGNSNVEKVWGFFKQNGFSDQATAGVIGNLMQESSTKINPSLKQKGGPGRGIAQWEIGSDRWRNLNSYAKKKGTNWDNLQTQLEFMLKEMQDGSAYWHKKNVQTKSYQSFKESTSVDQAVMDFERAYERAGKPNYKNRKKYANQVMETYGGSGPSAGGKIYRQENNEDMVKRAEALLKGIERTASVRAFGDFDLVTGNAVIIKEPFTGLNGKFYITGDTHTFADNTHVVELELSYENLMEEIDTAQKESGEETGISIGLSGGGSTQLTKAGDKYLGIPYVWGGKSRKGTDCSGFVQFVYQDVGIDFCPGRLTSAKMRGNYKSYGFEEVPVSSAKPGDIMWNKGHVAMMYDSKNVIEASPTKGKVLIQTAFNRNTPFTKAYRYVGGK